MTAYSYPLATCFPLSLPPLTPTGFRADGFPAPTPHGNSNDLEHFSCIYSNYLSTGAIVTLM